MKTGSGMGRFRKYRSLLQPSRARLPFNRVPARARLTFIVALGLLFAAVAGFVALGDGGGTTVSTTSFEGALRPPDLRAEPLTGLVDEDRKPLSLGRYRGQVVVMTFL